MSLSAPSQVSATTGSDHGCSVAPRFTSHAMTASRTTPTLWVLVITTGPSRKPDSSTHVVPVISPLPFSENQPANTGSLVALPRGRIAVTPVRRAFALDQRAFAADERDEADFDAGDVGDRIQRSGRAVERHPQIARARLSAAARRQVPRWRRGRRICMSRYYRELKSVQQSPSIPEDGDDQRDRGGGRVGQCARGRFSRPAAPTPWSSHGTTIEREAIIRRSADDHHARWSAVKGRLVDVGIDALILGLQMVSDRSRITTSIAFGDTRTGSCWA